MSLIVFEGLDGSGKSSLMKALENELLRRSIAFVRTREPGGTPLGDQIRELILRKEGPTPTPRTELLLYEASRAQHVDQIIRPALAQKKWVLCDRFTASSVAFQSGGRDISAEQVEYLNNFATDSLEVDLTVLLDLSVEDSKQRRQNRVTQTGEAEDRMESEAASFHQKVRESFLDQAARRSERWLVLDARRTPEELFQDLMTALKAKNILKGE